MELEFWVFENAAQIAEVQRIANQRCIVSNNVVYAIKSPEIVSISYVSFWQRLSIQVNREAKS